MKNKVLATCLKTYPDEDDMVKYTEGKIEPHQVKIYHKGRKYLVAKYFDESYFKLITNAPIIGKSSYKNEI